MKSYKRFLTKDVPFSEAVSLPTEHEAEAQAALDWWVTGGADTHGGTFGQGVDPEEGNAERYQFVLVGFDESAGDRRYTFRAHAVGGSQSAGSAVTFETPEDAVESIPPAPGLLWRGMSYEEYEDAVRSGVIGSRGAESDSLTGEPMTYFASNPAMALAYASPGFSAAMFLPSSNRPSYVIGVPDSQGSSASEHEGAVSEALGMDTDEYLVPSLPTSEIQQVWRVTPASFTYGEVTVVVGAAGEFRAEVDRLPGGTIAVERVKVKSYKRFVAKDPAFHEAVSEPDEPVSEPSRAEAQAALDWWVESRAGGGRMRRVDVPDWIEGGTWRENISSGEEQVEGRYQFVLGSSWGDDPHYYEFDLHPEGGTHSGGYLVFDDIGDAVHNIPDSGGMLWRGMSYEEYHRIVDSGVVQSAGSVSRHGEAGTYKPGDLTYFASSPEQAVMFAGHPLASLMFQPSSAKPGYVIGVDPSEIGEDDIDAHEWEHLIPPFPVSSVEQVWELRPASMHEGTVTFQVWSRVKYMGPDPGGHKLFGDEGGDLMVDGELKIVRVKVDAPATRGVQLRQVK